MKYNIKTRAMQRQEGRARVEKKAQRMKTTRTSTTIEVWKHMQQSTTRVEREAHSPQGREVRSDRGAESKTQRSMLWIVAEGEKAV